MQYVDSIVTNYLRIDWMFKHLISGRTCWQREKEFYRIWRLIFTNYRNIEYWNYKYTSHFQYLNWLHKCKFLVFEWYCHIEEINNDHKNKKYDNVKDYHINIPWQFLQPVNYPKSAKELGEIVYNRPLLPLTHHLYQRGLIMKKISKWIL